MFIWFSPLTEKLSADSQKETDYALCRTASFTYLCAAEPDQTGFGALPPIFPASTVFE